MRLVGVPDIRAEIIPIEPDSGNSGVGSNSSYKIIRYKLR